MLSVAFQGYPRCNAGPRSERAFTAENEHWG
jgi:hypothetical protein